jgi:esterase/lipase
MKHTTFSNINIPKICIILCLQLIIINNNQLIASSLDTLPAIYLVPGQGADARLFDSLKIDNRFEIRDIKYLTPAKNTTMSEFAHQLSVQIDTSRPFILIGVSLGGMLSTEMSDFLNPERIILISSAKKHTELPKRYTFQQKFPIYKAMPARTIKGGAKIMQPIVEPDRNQQKATFKSMLDKKDPKFLKRTIHMIINWERTSHRSDIIHIHGNNDKTIPIKNVNYDFLIENGSHMMALTRSQEISDIINEVLVQYLEENGK